MRDCLLVVMVATMCVLIAQAPQDARAECRADGISAGMTFQTGAR